MSLDIYQPLHSISFSLDAFNRQQKLNQTDSNTHTAPCYLPVNESDAEDLYQKISSGTQCILVLRGEYIITRPLSSLTKDSLTKDSSIKMVAVDEPEPTDSFDPNAFTPIKFAPALFNIQKLSSSLSQGTDGTAGMVIPSATLVVGADMADIFISLSNASSLSGIGVRMEVEHYNQSGCFPSQIEHTTESTHEVLWLASQAGGLCIQDNHRLILSSKEPRQAPPKHKSSSKKKSASVGSKAKQVDYQPSESVISYAEEGYTSTPVATAVGSASGGDKKKDDDDDTFLELFQRIKALFITARKSGATGEAKKCLKRAWLGIPDRFKKPIQTLLDKQYYGHNDFTRMLKKFNS